MNLAVIITDLKCILTDGGGNITGHVTRCQPGRLHYFWRW